MDTTQFYSPSPHRFGSVCWEISSQSGVGRTGPQGCGGGRLGGETEPNYQLSGFSLILPDSKSFLDEDPPFPRHDRGGFGKRVVSLSPCPFPPSQTTRRGHLFPGGPGNPRPHSRTQSRVPQAQALLVPRSPGGGSDDDNDDVSHGGPTCGGLVLRHLPRPWLRLPRDEKARKTEST